MKKLLVLFFAMSLVDCSNRELHSKNSGTAAPTPGIFIADKNAPTISQNVTPCNDLVAHFDPRLQKGTSLQYSTLTQDFKQPAWGYIETKTIDQVDTVNNFFIYTWNIQPTDTVLKTQVNSSQIKCQYGLADGAKCENIDPVAAPKQGNSDPTAGSQEMSFTFYTIDQGPTNTVTEDGFFQFTDGTRVRAQKTTYSITGSILANETKMGVASAPYAVDNGSFTTVTIISTDIPSLSPYFCKGTAETIYAEQTTKSDSGVVYNQSIHQLTDVKL